MNLTHKEGRDRVVSLVNRIKPARKYGDLEPFRKTLLETEFSEEVPEYMTIVEEFEYLRCKFGYTIEKRRYGKDISEELDFIFERVYRLYKHPDIGGICTQVLESDVQLLDMLRSQRFEDTLEYLLQIQKDLRHLQLIYQTIVDAIDQEKSAEDISIAPVKLAAGLTAAEKQAMTTNPNSRTRKEVLKE